MITNPRWLSASAIASCLVLAAAVGCGSGEKLYNVSGSATFEGKPIPAGIIYFDPDPMKGGTGTQGFANITDGQYTTAEDGQGVRGGAYVIRLTGYDGKTANEAPLGQPLFDEYVTTKDLPTNDTEVNFVITKKKSR